MSGTSANDEAKPDVEKGLVKVAVKQNKVQGEETEIRADAVASFNGWIDKWGLIDIKDPNRSFTWSNNQRCSILTVLDKTLISVELGIKYPTTKMVMLPKEASDHNPLLLDLGGQIQIKDPMFRFEKWLEIEGFGKIVKEVWQAKCTCSDPVDRWRYKIRLLRKKK
jgi:hypothetical protein